MHLFERNATPDLFDGQQLKNCLREEYILNFYDVKWAMNMRIRIFQLSISIPCERMWLETCGRVKK